MGDYPRTGEPSQYYMTKQPGLLSLSSLQLSSGQFGSE